MKCIQKIVLFGSLMVFTACVNQSEKIVKEEQKMQEIEKKSLNIQGMPLQTYEEYIKADRFMLEEYIKKEKRGDESGVTYLEDGTKIKYSFDNKYINETITNKKYPFIELSKGYYIDTKYVKGKIETVSDLLLGKEIDYNHWGKAVKVIDHDREMRALGLNYQKVLAWADEAGIIDLKEAKVLKGNRFFLNISTMEQAYDTKFTLEKQKEFIKNSNLTKEQGEALFRYKNYWSFSVDYDWEKQYYMLAADGTFIKKSGTIEKLR